MNDLQLFQFVDKYARWNDDLSRRETWGETISRAVDYLIELSNNKLDPKIYERMYQLMYNMEIAPSMRLLAMAGQPARRNNIAIYNCAFLSLDSVDSFVELMVVLLEGAGCGYSVESKYIYKLPIVKKLSGNVQYHSIDDTSEGWYESFRLLLNNLYNGTETKFDYSMIRPAGSRLKIKGGTASGYEPLKRLFDFCKLTFKNAQGRKLNNLECHDIACHVGDAIVSGGVRRSALIALFDESDETMLNSKSVESEWWVNHIYRARANNSIVINEHKDYQWFVDYVKQMDDSQAGEPGIISRYAMQNTIPDRRKFDENYGSNPCLLYASKILTPYGIKLLGEIKIGDIIWSKEGWTTVTNKIMTGIKTVYKYSTTANEICLTDNHPVISKGQIIEAGNAEFLDIFTGEYLYQPDRSRNLQAVIDGLVLGDGIANKSIERVGLCVGANDSEYFNDEISTYILEKRGSRQEYNVNTTLDFTIGYTYERQVPDNYLLGSYFDKADFLRGLFSANGSVVAHGKRVTLKSASYQLVKQVQLMLNSLGIRSYHTTNKAKSVEFNNGTYVCKQSYDLNISTDREMFLELIGFIQPYKNEKIVPNKDSVYAVSRPKSSFEIVSVEDLGEHEVYDITVNNESHTFWCDGCDIHNCGEIYLKPFQFCNLSIVVAKPNDTIETLEEKVYYASIIGTIQSMATNFKGLRPIWKENCEAERLLGVDITGQYDCPLLINEGNEFVFELLKVLAVNTNKYFANELGINQSVAVTCVKPSGNSSVLFNCSSGLHPRHGKYYLRRVRIQSSSPVAQWLYDCGFTLEQDKGQTSSLVATFPIEAPDSLYKADLTALDQLEHWKVNKLYWTEHNPSITVSYHKEELGDMAKWLYENQDIIGGLSFMPQNDTVYEQLPNEVVSQAVYEYWKSITPHLDLSLLVEYVDNTTVAQELACVSGNCEV